MRSDFSSNNSDFSLNTDKLYVRIIFSLGKTLQSVVILKSGIYPANNTRGEIETTSKRGGCWSPCRAKYSEVFSGWQVSPTLMGQTKK